MTLVDTNVLLDVFIGAHAAVAGLRQPQ